MILPAIAAAFLGWYYISFYHQFSNLELLNGLRRIRDSSSPRHDARVALGYNGCLDAIVDTLSLFKTAGISPSQSKDVSVISSIEDLASVLEFHFGKAGERAVTVRETFDILEDALRRTPHRKALGGNAALMADVLVRDWGFKNVVLGAQVGQFMKQLLSPHLRTVGHDEATDFKVGGSSVIPIRSDEIHLIMEYNKGDSWGHRVASRANRFIVSHDLSNAFLAPMDNLHKELQGPKPYDLLVASGFHMLDSQEVPIRKARLKEISTSFRNIPKATRVHAELASIGDASLLDDIVNQILPHVDSIGLNEQELASLFDVLDSKHLDLKHESLGDSVPDVAIVSLAIEHIFTSIPRGTRSLNRLHFHCLGYHIIAQTNHGMKRWPNPASAVAAGSIKASERACNSTDLTDQQISLQMPTSIHPTKESAVTITVSAPVATWISNDIHFELAPVLTCNSPVQTVGLGDSISATAIGFQV